MKKRISLISLVTIVFILLFVNLSNAEEKLLYPKAPAIYGNQLVFNYLGVLWNVNIETKEYYPLIMNDNYNTSPKFSPDGKYIAYTSLKEGNADIYIINLKSKEINRLTFDSLSDNCIGWTNDSKNVLFTSFRGNFPGVAKLYTISIKGGNPIEIGSDKASCGSYEPDGKRIVINRKSTLELRKGYRGPYNTNLWVFDPSKKSYKKITDFDGADRRPMWAKDGFIYYVSDKDGNFNIWRCKDDGSDKEQITFHEISNVKYPYLDKENNKIVYEHNFTLYMLDLDTKNSEKIMLDFWKTPVQKKVFYRRYINTVDDFDLSPTSMQITYSVRGEIFTGPVEKGDCTQITRSPSRDKNPKWSPDGKNIAYISDKTGEEQIFIYNIETNETKQVTDREGIKINVFWAPNSENILISEYDGCLYNYNIKTQNEIKLIDIDYGYIFYASWSPDSKWIAYSCDTENYHDEIFMMELNDRDPINITDYARDDIAPVFSKDGKELYFISNREGSYQLYSLPLLPEKRDPLDYELKLKEDEQKLLEKEEKIKKGIPVVPEPEKKIELNYDLKRLKSRLRRVTNLLGGIISEPVSNRKGDKFYFVGYSLIGKYTYFIIYSIDKDGKNLTQLSQSLSPIDYVMLSRDEKSLFFKERTTPYKLDIETKSKKPIYINVNIAIDDEKEKLQIFNEAWRIIKHRFYDENLHGKDWDKIKSIYEPKVKLTANRNELAALLREMFGELNSSHTYAGYYGNRSFGSITPTLPIDFMKDPVSRRYRVKYIYPESSADKDYIIIKPGFYLLSINGIDITTEENLAKLLNKISNKRWVDVTVNIKPTYEKAFTFRMKTINIGELYDLRYKRWVEQNRIKVEKLSKGQLGYLHIRYMNYDKLHQFYLDIQKLKHKKGVIIDIRFNGGGNIDQPLLDYLERRQYQVFWMRNTQEARTRPYHGYFGKKVVLINEYCGSNAEMFPQGFKDLGLGKVIGMPTFGAVIGVGPYKLLGEMYMGVPGIGLKTVKGRDLENNPVEPDIKIDNSPEDYHKNKDTQLETAVKYLIKEITEDKKKISDKK